MRSDLSSPEMFAAVEHIRESLRRSGRRRREENVPEQPEGIYRFQLQADRFDNAVTRREATKRLGAGALFLFTLRDMSADEEKTGAGKRPLLSSRLHVG